MADSTDEAIRRQILLALASVVAFVLAAGVALAISRSDDAGDDDGVVVATEALSGTGSGPFAGTDIATYSEGRRRALAEARGRWVAIVSFREYVTEQEAKRRYSGFDVKALLVALEGGEPEVVDEPVSSWIWKARTRAEEERGQLQSMADTTDDKVFREQFQADIDRLGKLLATIDPSKPIVFGAVVSASTSQLRTLVEQADVRLVDLVGRRSPSPLREVRGLRPEETVVAGEPRTRPV